MLLKTLLATLPAFSFPASGSPADAKLVKRDATEVIYLTAVTIPLNPPYYLSYLAYYPTTSLGYSGALPLAQNEALGEWGGSKMWNTWPTTCTGNTHYEIEFPSGVLFQFDLNHGAGDAAVGATIGGGWNGFNAFTCVKDSGRRLYTVNSDGAEVLVLMNCTRA